MIKRIEVSKYGIGVNCYLVQQGDQYILIDTGWSSSRAKIEAQLSAAGCNANNLRFILLTHADLDHAGNAAYLRTKYGAKIALHQAENETAQSGEMSKNRKNLSPLVKYLATLSPAKLSKQDCFSPDILLSDGESLAPLGINASVLHTPGHSSGSISFYFDTGDLFCGDLFANQRRPMLNSLMDDLSAGESSVRKLNDLKITTIHPGHGNPFTRDQLQQRGKN